MENYNEMLVKVFVQGAKNKEEEDWARDLGMSAYQWFAHNIANKWLNRFYEKLWNVFRKGDDPFDEDSKGLKIYQAIANWIVSIVVLIKGGYSLSRRRKVVVNCLYYMKPIENEHYNYYIDDMIFLKNWA